MEEGRGGEERYFLRKEGRWQEGRESGKDGGRSSFMSAIFRDRLLRLLSFISSLPAYFCFQ